MLRSSFRLLVLEFRVYPRHPPRKRPQLAILPLVALLAGCGGGGGGGKTTTVAENGAHVAGKGFTFTAPTSWHPSHSSTTVTVRPGGEGPTLASVTTLTLRRPYTPALFAKTARETDR